MTNRPSSITVHAGFHKTGTTSAQGFIRANWRTLARHATLMLKKQISKPVFFARKYAVDRDPMTRNAFRFNFISCLGELELNRNSRPLIISAEDLSGTMPGYRGIANYSAAADLAEDVVDALRHHFGADVPINLLYTVRGRDAWMRSLWARHVWRGYTDQDFDDYTRDHADVLDIDPVLQDISARVGNASVSAIALEEVATHQFGPGAIFLTPLDLPDRAYQHLVPPPHKNKSHPPDRLAQMLERNRAQGIRQSDEV